MGAESQSRQIRGAPGALDGVRVIDMSRFIAGPYCSMILGDMVADVVKIEKPGRGDPARNYQPQLGGRSLYSPMPNLS